MTTLTIDELSRSAKRRFGWPGDANCIRPAFVPDAVRIGPVQPCANAPAAGLARPLLDLRLQHEVDGK